MTEADILAEQVVENVVRADLQPVEQGRAYKRLMDAERLDGPASSPRPSGSSPRRSIARLSLLKLPDDVAAKVDAGEIKATAAYEISKLQIADDQREVAERVVAEGLDHKATAAEVRSRRDSRSAGTRRGRRPPAEQRYRGARGVRVTVQTTAKHTLEDVVADLRQIADRLEAKATAEAA